MKRHEFSEHSAGVARAAGRPRRASVWQRGGAMLSLAFLSCAGDEGAPDTPPSHPGELPGELSVGLGVAGADVTALRIDVVAANADCTAEPIASRTIELSPGGDDAGAGASPEQSNAWFTVPAGDVRVCVTPLSGDAPSERCQPAEEVAHIEAGQRTEVRLVVQCRSPDDGILDTVVRLNEAPRVSQLTLAPGDVISSCESVNLTATASDADGDALTYTWSVGDPLRLRPYEGVLEAAGAEATFSATIAGSYRVNLGVDDGHGGATELSIPIQVTEGTCARD